MLPRDAALHESGSDAVYEHDCSLLDERARKNIDAIKEGLENRRVLTFGVFLLYACSPLPSNYLFIAYGLTTLRLALVGFPFFIGGLRVTAFG
jgi:hypothetical protein